MKTQPRLLLPLLLILTACDREPSAPATLPPQAAAEYQQLCARMQSEAEQTLSLLDEHKPFFGEESPYHADIRRLTQESLQLLRAYERSGDVSLRTPTVQQTLLHLAIQHRMEELVRELLRQGADPNAICDFSFMGRGKMDVPLAWVAVPQIIGEELRHKPYADTAICLADMLEAAGARLDGDGGGHALLMCSISGYEGAEDLYLHLLKLGARPGCGYFHQDTTGQAPERIYLHSATDFLLRNHWARALSELISREYIPADWRTLEEKTLLFTVLEHHLRDSRNALSRDASPQENEAQLRQESAERLELVRLLLQRGADPNAPQGGGWTPMCYAAALSPRHPAALPAWREMRELLLRHGGDRQATVPAHRGLPARSVEEWLNNEPDHS